MRHIISYLVVLTLIGACGGSNAPTQTQDPVPPPLDLDFSAIAGPWAGWGVESLPDGSTRSSWIGIDVEESAVEGEDVGSFRVGLALGDTLCGMRLRALASDPPEYRIQILNGGAGCEGAMMDVEHDTDAGVLFLDITNSGENFSTSHVLEPGTDPGPAPNARTSEAGRFRETAPSTRMRSPGRTGR